MRQRLLIVATAILLVGFASTALPRIDGQVPVGTSTLTGTVCATDPPIDGGREATPSTYPEKVEGCMGVLPGATVRLTRPGVGGSVGGVDKTATTDAEGRFAFDTLPNGDDYTLEASKLHFTKATVTAKVNGTSRQDVALVGEVFQQSGKVVDEAGRPVADAYVRAPYDGEDPAAVPTAADGTFTLQVRAGYRSIQVVDASGFEDLHDYRLLDGSALTLTLRALPKPDATVTGIVRDQDGTPLAGIRIDAWSSSPCCPEPMPASGGGSAPSSPSSTVVYPGYSGGNHTRTDAEGRYRIGVFAGQVSLNVNSGAEPDRRFASKSVYLEVARGETATQDVRLMRFPPKTAHIEGQVTGAGGKGLAAVTVSVRSPEYGLYECSTNTMGGGPVYATMVAEDKAASAMPIREAPPCAISIDADGRFSGDVTPGYAIIEVSYQIWQACPQAPDEPYQTPSCTPDYYPWAKSMVLAKDATTTLDVRLTERPGPDATVSGYVVDAETGKAIPGASIWFSNMDHGAYGQATTDKDGSYKVRLRSGYHMVGAAVYAQDGSPGGYLSWQGILQVPAGEHAFDVKLTPGEESYGGGCCYYPMAEGRDTMAAAPASGAQGAKGGSGEDAMSSQATGSAQAFEDLGGGLGPYDASKRGALLQADQPGKTSPTLEAVALVVVLAGLAFVRRRR
jgi:hypothetical protein